MPPRQRGAAGFDQISGPIRLAASSPANTDASVQDTGRQSGRHKLGADGSAESVAVWTGASAIAPTGDAGLVSPRTGAATIATEMNATPKRVSSSHPTPLLRAGAQFVRDPELVLREMVRVTRLGGVVVAAEVTNASDTLVDSIAVDDPPDGGAAAVPPDLSAGTAISLPGPESADHEPDCSGQRPPKWPPQTA